MIDQLLLDNYTSGAYFEVILTSRPLGILGAPVGMCGRFFSVSGLSMELEYETYREGGSMYPRYFLKGALPQTLVLEQGTVTTVDMFSMWITMANQGIGVTVDGVVTLKNHSGMVMRVWNIWDAHVVKYIGPNLDSNNVQLAVTRIELMYGGCA